MTFNTYDILSALIPGFLVLFVISMVADYKYDKDLIVGYTVVAFLAGYYLNAVSGWLEPFYYRTFRGKQSDQLLDGKSDWKVRFTEADKVKKFLIEELGKPEFTNDDLFRVAMREVHGTKDTRVNDFNAIYAFSRVVLTTVLISTILLATQYYSNWRFYLIAIPFLAASWVRCRERGFYFAREVLNEYLKQKTKKEKGETRKLRVYGRSKNRMYW